jgi:hypothetical protein
MIVDVDRNIRNALCSLHLDSYREIKIARNDEELAWQPVKSKELMATTVFSDPRTAWLMIIPTYVTTMLKISSREENKKGLGYILSPAIGIAHNLKAPLMHIQLQTPGMIVPMMCSLCLKIPDYYANRCTPGQGVCRTNADFSGIPDEKLFKESIEQSIASTTKEDTACLDTLLLD